MSAFRIENARVLDPASGFDGVKAITVRDGRIVEGGSVDRVIDGRSASMLDTCIECGGDCWPDHERNYRDFIERDFDATAAAHPELTPAQVLAKVLTDEGYAAGVRQLPVAGKVEAEQLCQQHCPVSHVAHEFPQLCEAETAAIAKVVGSHVQRLATIAHGNGVCTTCIPTPTNTET